MYTAKSKFNKKIDILSYGKIRDGMENVPGISTAINNEILIEHWSSVKKKVDKIRIFAIQYSTFVLVSM